MTEQRLIDIEVKVATQEDLTQALSQQLYEQQKQIVELRALCAILVRRLDESDGPDSHAQERPPHY